MKNLLEVVEKAGMRPPYRSHNIMRTTNYVPWEPEHEEK